MRRVSELIRGVIELLWNRPDGLSAKEIVVFIPEVVKLTDHEMGISPSSTTPRYEKIIRLATMPLVRVGWLIKNDKGRWYLTDDGRGACRRFSDSHELYQEALRLSEERKQDIPEMLMLLDMFQEKAWEYIQKYIQEKTLIEVRRLVAVLFEAMQYHVTWVAPPEKNRGSIDLVANADPLGAGNYRILVQVKHKGQPVTMEGVKSFLSMLGPNDFGLLMSTGGFTSDVREETGKGGYQKINAMDVEKFFDIWIRHYDKLSREAHSLLPLKAIFVLSPSN
jgi:restriction system protein